MGGAVVSLHDDEIRGSMLRSCAEQDIDPTSALDPEMIAAVLDVMKEPACRGMTMIVLTRWASLARSRIGWCSWPMARSSRWARPEHFFRNPTEDRTKLFLNQTL